MATLLLAMALSVPALAGSQPLGRFERLRAQDLRVASVAYRLSTGNAGLCRGVLAPQPGFVLHSIDQYGPADRQAVAISFGLALRVSVMAVVDGSPADKAGLVAGDQLLSVNERALGDIGTGSIPTRASVDRAQAILAEEMTRGPVVLRVAGPSGERDLRFTAETGCPANAEFVPGDEVNAWADGARVMVSDGLLRRCENDDDLALVIGHEMAHNLLHHRRRLAAEGISANRLLPLTRAGSLAMRETEEEADEFAVRLASGARYDLSGAEAFMRGLINRDVPVAATHPDPDRRLALLHAAIAGARAG